MSVCCEKSFANFLTELKNSQKFGFMSFGNLRFQSGFTFIDHINAFVEQ